jgi:hypothetical protein
MPRQPTTMSRAASATRQSSSMRAGSTTRGNATVLPCASARSISGSAFHSLRNGAVRSTVRAAANAGSSAMLAQSAREASSRHPAPSASRAAAMRVRIACLASRSGAPTGATVRSCGMRAILRRPLEGAPRRL